jgi:hypothetical protein
MNPSDPERALLELVEADRVERCTAIGREADDAAQALLRDARKSARGRVGEAMKVERRRLHERLAALDAALATETRLHEQRRLRALLDEAWGRLPAAIEARWRDSGGRRQWTRQILDGARSELERGDCSLRYAPGWPDDERDAAIAELAAAGFPVVTCTQDSAMRAGLQVRSRGNVLDGTLAGLLADRNAIGARTLDELSRSEA